MHKGSCLCSAVTFEIEGELAVPDACHCSRCRKLSGHFFASADVPRHQISIQGGENVTWYQSSENVRHDFLSCHERSQVTACAPVISTNEPHINAASSDARNATRAATSSGFPIRPNGTSLSRSAIVRPEFHSSAWADLRVFCCLRVDKVKRKNYIAGTWFFWPYGGGKFERGLRV